MMQHVYPPEPPWERVRAWLPVRVDDGISWCGGTRSVSITRWLCGVRWLCLVDRRRVCVRDYLWNRTDCSWVFRAVPRY